MNPYAPPAARVEDAAFETAPALWNPNAAANWSLLFSPAFGSLLVYLNWKAIGNESEAKTAQLLFYVNLAVLALVMGTNFRGIALPWLIAWYFASARRQAKFVREHYGNDYPRKGWGKPLGLAVLALVGCIVVLVAVELAFK
jgi:hypothetical protein